MSLFKERIHYKPFDYDWAFESYDTMQKMHWLPSEVPLHEDIRDWNERLTKEEKNLINQILNSINIEPPSEASQLKIFQLFSHAHQLMTRFDILILHPDGDEELIYTALDYEHPPVL